MYFHNWIDLFACKTLLEVTSNAIVMETGKIEEKRETGEK